MLRACIFHACFHNGSYNQYPGHKARDVEPGVRPRGCRVGAAPNGLRSAASVTGKPCTKRVCMHCCASPYMKHEQCGRVDAGLIGRRSSMKTWAMSMKYFRKAVILTLMWPEPVA